MDLFKCDWDTAKFLIFSNNVFDPLIYYSHLLPMISALILGFFVYFNNKNNLINKLFFLLTLCFSLWVYFDLILWASEKSEIIMFFWSSMIYVEYAMFVLGFWLFYTFLFKQKVKVKHKIFFILGFIPILLFSHTDLSLTTYDLTNCDREPFEGSLWIYLYSLEGIISIYLLALFAKFYKVNKDQKNKLQNTLFGLGTWLFLTAFFVGNVLLIYLGTSYEQYKLFGMLLFLLILLFIIVKFKTFNTKMIAAQALIGVILILIISQLFFVKSNLSRILTLVTLVFTTISGYYLIKSVKQVEIQKRELEKSNQNQQSLLHFITHQVKGVLTKSRNIFDGILSGEYGEVNDKVKIMAKYGFDSDTKGVETVQSILKASDLKSGKTVFEKTKINLSKLIAEIVEKGKPAAQRKNLELSFEIEPNILIEVDPLKISEVFQNLIDNAITYTSAGEVKVVLRASKTDVKFSVIDTGFGLNHEDIKHLFTEGGKGKDSLSINVDSTGYGLFVAKKIVDEHGGKIGAKSEGRNKGSEFFVILPQIQ